MVVNFFHPENNKFLKNKATIQIRMMAPKVSGDAELGCHHPPVAALSGTGIFPTTIRYTIRTVLSCAKSRSFTMARLNIVLAIKLAACGAKVNESN